MITHAPAEFIAALPEAGRLAGLDAGTKTIGLALCDAGWSIATPAHTIRRGKFAADFAELKTFVGAQSVRGLVIAVVFLAAVVSVLIAVDAELKVESSPVRTANAAGYLLAAAGLYALGITTAAAVSGPVGIGMAGAGLALVLLTLRVLQEARAVRDGRETAADAWWNGGPVVRAGTGTARRTAQRTADAAQGRAEQLRLRLAERTPAPEAEAPATAPDAPVPAAPNVAEPAPGLRRRLRRAIVALVDEG